MKAYCVYPGNNAFDFGCVLVYAEKRNDAKMIAFKKGPFENDYVELRAVRKPILDKHYTGQRLVETNEELPDGVTFFMDFCGSGGWV